MDDSLYDEFRNYISPEIESDKDSDRDEEQDDVQMHDHDEEDTNEDGDVAWLARTHDPLDHHNHQGPDDDDDVDMEGQMVLAKDKKYYPTVEEFYGEGVETLVMEEDAQPLEQPIIKPVKNIKFKIGVKDSTTYVSTDFLLGLMSNPKLVRNVALVGHLQHGKTLFMDMLIEQTHHIATFDVNNQKHMQYRNTRVDEQERRISIKAVPMSLILEDDNAKSYLCNIMDTLGHVKFFDEMTATVRLASGAILVVDANDDVMNQERRQR